ncbi:MAG TPA: nuclear transport factor 2 family protein [Solirubrobacterales bacterium]|jgi:ketosteroid isomerase-like protein
MSRENVDLVRRIYAEGREYTGFFDAEATEMELADWRPRYDPEYEFHAVVEGNRLVEQGLDGYVRLMRDWLAPWESYTIAGDEFYDLEPDRVAVTTRHHGRLKDGGAEIRTEGVDVWTLRDGRFLRLEAYLDREKGLEAAGIRR